jgi:hypothetical protein
MLILVVTAVNSVERGPDATEAFEEKGAEIRTGQLSSSGLHTA